MATLLQPVSVIVERQGFDGLIALPGIGEGIARSIYEYVAIYFYDDEHHENQHTVVTETRGSLRGKRVVRGRESECHEYYS